MRLEPTLAAAALIKTGTIYDMGRVFEEEMPLFSLIRTIWLLEIAHHPIKYIL